MNAGGFRPHGSQFRRDRRIGPAAFARERGSSLHVPHKSGKDTYLIYAATVLFGRKRPSFRILLLRVVRLTPSLFAAPFGPPITQFVSIRVLRMWLYSASPSVTGGAGLTCSAHRRLSNGARSVAPGDRMTARSTKFCSSRTFPGQAYCIRAAIVSTGTVSTRRFIRREQSLTKAATSKGMSSRRCRSGGTAIGKMLRRK